MGISFRERFVTLPVNEWKAIAHAALAVDDIKRLQNLAKRAPKILLDIVNEKNWLAKSLGDGNLEKIDLLIELYKKMIRNMNGVLAHGYV